MIFITSTAFITILLILTTAFLIAALGVIRRLNSLPGVIPLFLFYIMAFTWIFAYLMFMAYPDPYTALIFYKLSIPAKSYACVFLMLFALHFTSPYLNIKPHIWISVLLIPTATLALMLTHQELILKDIDINLFYTSKHLSIIKGVWFYVNALYGYICLLLSIGFFIGHYKISSVLYKWQSSVFIVAISAFSILDLTGFQTGYDSEGGILGLLTLCVILFYTYLHFKTSDLAFLAIGAVFDKISSIVIIVEDNGSILFMNTQGRKKFAFISPNCEGMPYQKLIDTWIHERGGIIRQDNGMTIITVDENPQKYYELLRSSVTDKNELNIGSFIELRDITVQQELIARLYHMVNYDQLTNLFNRRYFEDQCVRLDKEEYLPLAFISGDLNNLKNINDSFGHAYGDKLIIATADSMRRLTPDNGSACRTGGDEFVVIIPNCSEEQAKAYIDSLISYTDVFREEPYGKIDISLGYAVRKAMDEPIEQILRESDMVMYKDKENKKVSFRQNARPYNKY